jgi:hypothetical protein
MPDVAEFCAALRQGDLLATTEVVVGGIANATPHGVVVVSQTCDLVRPDKHPNVVVASAVELDDVLASEAERGRTARWVPVPGAPSRLFADLNQVTSIPKADASQLAVTHCVPDDAWDDQRLLAQQIGRWFSRVAIPDVLIPWLAPMQKLVLDRANKPTSPLGRLLDSVVQFRIHSKMWVEPYDITLSLIVSPGELPILEDDHFKPLSPELMATLGDAPTPSQAADLLFPEVQQRPVNSDRQALWLEFAAALQRLIEESGSNSGAPRAVRDVTVEVVGEDEFTLSQVRRSAELDFAHLSPATPVSDSID